MDCCHSGTNTREFLPPDAPVKQRYPPSPWGLVAAEVGPEPAAQGPQRAPQSARRAQGQGHRQRRPSRAPHHRMSRHANVGSAFINGRYNGALTYGLVNAIRKAKGKLSYQDSARSDQFAVLKQKFDQVPQLEGQKTRFGQPLFTP